MGLSVVLPPEDFTAAMSWQLEIDLSCPNRPFNVKHGKVGFNPERATTFVSHHEGLHVWAIFVREADLGVEAEAEAEADLGAKAKTLPAGSTFSGISTLSSKHLRIFQSWVLYMLSKIKYPGITCLQSRRYNINLNDSPAQWNFATGFKCASLIIMSSISIINLVIP